MKSIVAKEVFLPFPEPVYEAHFLRRPQRFLAEISLPNCTEELAYCPNSGAMSGCLNAGSKALVWDSGDPKRARRYTLRAIELNGVWVGTDTHLSNRVVERALESKLIPGFESYGISAREYRIERGVRVDFRLESCTDECLVEVKSVMIAENGTARYPDSVTPRGVKQLRALTQQAEIGKRALILFLVQRGDAQVFNVTASVDPVYATVFKEAVASGVEVLALGVSVGRSGFSHPRLLQCVSDLTSTSTRPTKQVE